MSQINIDSPNLGISILNKYQLQKDKQSYNKYISAPDFVKMLEDEDYVYFFLREQAVEYINCGKV